MAGKDAAALPEELTPRSGRPGRAGPARRTPLPTLRAPRSDTLHSYACVGVSTPDHKLPELIAGALLALR